MNSEARHRHIAKLEEVIARGEEAQRLLDDFDKRLEAVVLPFIEEEQNETNPAEVREAPARRFSGMLQQDAIMEVLRRTDGRVTLDELMAELEGGGLTPPRKSVVSCLSRATKADTIQKYSRGVWGTKRPGNSSGGGLGGR